MTKTGNILKIAFLALTCISLCQAQIPTQNLFRRSQYIQYLKLQKPQPFDSPLRNAPYSLPQFPITCSVEKPVYDRWLTAEMSFALTRWYEAAMQYNDLIQLDSSFCDPYFRLAQCFVARSNLVQAHRILSVAARKFPKHPLLFTGLGQLYLFLARPETALNYFKQQMENFPNDPEGYLGASWALFELREYKSSVSKLEVGRDLLIAQLNQADQYGTHNTSQLLLSSVDYLYLFESMLRLRLRENDAAWAALRKVKTETDREITAFKNYCEGMYFYNQGEDYYNKARRNLTKVAPAGIILDDRIAREVGIKVDPTDFRSILLLERYNDKLKTVREKSNTPLADSLFDHRQSLEASGYYRAALEQDSSNYHALLRLATCYRQLNRDDEALDLYQYALRHHSHEPKLALLLARQLVQMKRYDAAVDAYNHAIELDRKDPRGYFGACLALAQIGEYRKALDVYNSNPALADRGKSNWVQGMLLYNLNLPAFALTSLNVADQSSVYTDYYLGLTYHALGGGERNAKAADHIYQAIKQGAIVDDQTIALVGLDPKTFFNLN